MNSLALNAPAPRKTAVQARSRATVSAIHDATVQVLLAEGPTRLTTTRVAERAGVSIGTLYQYYPNKRSLLFAVVRHQVEKVASAVERACLTLDGQPIATMVEGLVLAYADVKLERVDVSQALYAVADTIDTASLIAGFARRTEAAVAAMLATAPNLRLNDPAAAFMVMAVISGVIRAAFERGDVGGRGDDLRGRIQAMCLAYLEGAAAH